MEDLLIFQWITHPGGDEKTYHNKVHYLLVSSSQFPIRLQYMNILLEILAFDAKPFRTP